MLTGYQVTLRDVVENDLDQLREWRNLPEVRQFMLSDSTIDDEQQRAWFKKVQRDKTQRHFVIEYKGQAIGSANIKSRGNNIPIEQANVIEPGLYIGEAKYRQNILAFAPTLLLNDYCFNKLGVTKLVAVVKPDNQAALNYNAKLGYKVVNQGELIDISLNFEDYQLHTQQLKAFLSR
ncbi:GNAT family N-acetyltransferase [Aestuariibacter sp. AA17]|uniref:GNAT family N-acetyltransferase n=1 Tax=Fluctibacter corallii TaxID=2984329 RepID=A0ABT3A9W1_9ALTE|nr:GNAT family N-acetyltransferase [Aestuariibacter sp. AA17]MCV2885458.1 GNAT family N-acetyltransferase [Aestuariibacter sp. AA17]